MNKIKIIVSGGVVQDVVIPKGTKAIVEIYDYDVESCDEDCLDKDGNECMIAVWE